MAFSIYDKHGEMNSTIDYTFLCDAETDIASLPTQDTHSNEYPSGVSAGSKAIILTENAIAVYMLNNSGMWVKVG